MAVAILDTFADLATGFIPSSGDDRFMLIFQHLTGSTQTITAASYGGESLTLEVEITDDSVGFPTHMIVWSLDEAGIANLSGSPAFAIDTGSVNGSNIQTRVVLSGVDQADAVEATATGAGVNGDGGSADIATFTIATAADGYAAVGMMQDHDAGEGESIDINSPPWTERIETETSDAGNTYFTADTLTDGTTEDIDLDTPLDGQFDNQKCAAAISLNPAANTTVDGDITGFLATVSGQIDVINSVFGDVTGFLPTVSAFVEHDVFVDGDITGFLPSVDAAIDVIVAVDGSIAGFLPSVSGFIQHDVFVDGDITGFLPTVSATVQGGNAVNADIAGFLPTVSAFIEHNVFVDAPIAGFLPQVSGFVEVGATLDGTILGFLPTVSAVVTLPIPVDGDVQGFLPTISAFIEVPAVVDGAITGYLPQVSSFIDSGQEDPIGGSAGSRGVRQQDDTFDRMRRTQVSEALDEEDFLDLMTAIIPALAQRKI